MKVGMLVVIIGAIMFVIGLVFGVLVNIVFKNIMRGIRIETLKKN